MTRLALTLLAMLTLSACGLQPMYAGGGSGAVAQGLAAVEVPPIEGRAGWLVRNALRDRLAQSGDSAAARYQLVDLASGEILLDASAGSDAGIDVVSSEYATIAAEETALENLAKDVADRIVSRLALTLRGQS